MNLRVVAVAACFLLTQRAAAQSGAPIAPAPSTAASPAGAEDGAELAPPEVAGPHTPAAAPGRPHAEEVPARSAGASAGSAAAPGAAATSQPAEDETPSAASRAPSFLERLTRRTELQIHGFVSEGGFISTSNKYIGESSRGSLKFFEGGINFSLELLDRLRVGLQFVSRSVGALSEEVPRLDWAVADYRWKAWLGVRAGVIKMPLGLYNEYIGIDAARTAILLPQSLYPMRNRDALLSHTGFALYGNVAIGVAGALDYQVWLGTLTIPRSALELDGATLDGVDTRYVAGAQLFWRTPLEGLRVGATYLRASIDFDLTLDPSLIQQVAMAGLAPAGYDGKLTISQRPTSFWVISAEYIIGDWLFAAEYSRWLKHQQSTQPKIVPTTDDDEERLYALASYRVSPHVELGGYYSVVHGAVADRGGRDAKRFTKRFHGFQRDLAATLRLDVNDYWLWKLEGHFIDGTAELVDSINPNPQRYWGLFLLRTTVTF